MLTGEPPFTGATAQAVVARVVTESPRPLAAAAPHDSAPRRGGGADRAREAPADRFATAAEFAEALRDKSYHVHRVDARRRLPPRGREQAARAAPPAGRARAGARRGAGRALAAALWGWLRPAPVPPLSQFSLALKSAQALQPPSDAGGARLALSRDGRSLAYSRARRGRHAPLAPAVRPARRDARRRDRRRLQPVLLAGRRPGGVHQERQPGADRVARGRAHRHADRQGQQQLRRLGRRRVRLLRGGLGRGRMRATGGEIEPVYKIQPKAKEIATEWVHVLPGAHRRPVPAPPRGSGSGRLRDHGESAPARPAAVARARRVRDLLADAAISWWSPPTAS